MIPSGRLIPHAAVVLAILVWSSSFIALKIALSAYSPLTVMAGRMLAASLICLPLLPPVLRFARRSPAPHFAAQRVVRTLSVLFV